MATPSKGPENICSMCNQTEDEGEEDNIWWIECSSALCSREYHLSCVGLTLDTLPKKHIRWYCLFCKHERKEVRRSLRLTSPRYMRSPYKRYRERQPNHDNNGIKLLDILEKNGDIDVSINSLASVQKESRDVGKNFVSFLFLALITFLLAYLFLSYQDFNAFVSF